MGFFAVKQTAKRSHTSIENPQTIGEHLRKRRQELTLLQKDLAKMVGVSVDTITYWETGRSSPYIAYYRKIILFLGYSPFPTDISTLGGRIYKYRIEKGISQEELAKMTGVNESTIFHWEKYAPPHQVKGKN